MAHVQSTAPTPPLTVATSTEGVDVLASVTLHDGMHVLDVTVSNEGGNEAFDAVVETVNVIRNMDHMQVRELVEQRLESIADDPYAATLDVVAETLEAMMEGAQ